MAFPHLLFPLSRKLETLAPDVFLPGVGVLPNDFIMAVKTNPRFVEALMVGANHEMGREMLWQGLPTDQRGTPFQHFWQRLDGKPDIAFIHQWNAALPLGSQPGNTPMIVLLIPRPTARALPEPVDLRLPDRRTRRSGRAVPVRRTPGTRSPKWIRHQGAARPARPPRRRHHLCRHFRSRPTTSASTSSSSRST